MDYKEALEMLRKAGFSAAQMDRLCSIRRAYRNETGQPDAEHRRLEFVRWLVAKGKLNEQIA